MQRVHPLGISAGELVEEWANKLGLNKGTPVAVSVIDAHAAVLGSSVADAGKMVLALETSTCHLAINERWDKCWWKLAGNDNTL